MVRQYDQELGMVSEAAIKEFFKMFPVDEEVKDEEFAGRQVQFQQMRWNVNDSLPNASFLENFNKTLRNSYGSEIVMYNSLSQEIKLDDQLNSFMLIKEEQKYRISDGRPSNLSNSDFIGSQISFGFNNNNNSKDEADPRSGSQIIEEEKFNKSYEVQIRADQEQN